MNIQPYYLITATKYRNSLKNSQEKEMWAILLNFRVENYLTLLICGRV